MIHTNYVGMQIGAFTVISHQIDIENKEIVLKVKCNNCNEYKIVKLIYERVLKIKCRSCGRLDILLPIEYYDNINLVKDTLTVGAYKYKKIKAMYNEEGGGLSELDFIRKKILNDT